MKEKKLTITIDQQNHNYDYSVLKSVTSLKVVWGDCKNQHYVLERLSEIHDFLFGLLRSPNNIHTLDLTDLIGYDTNWHYSDLFRNDISFITFCQIKNLYLPKTEKEVRLRKFPSLQFLYAPGAISLFLQNIPRLDKIIFGNSIKNIQFENVGITKIDIPSTVKSIVINCCNSLKELNIPNGVKLPAYAISGNEDLEEVVLPKSLTVIEPHLFQGCRRLRTVRGGKSLKYIFPSAFNGCLSLETVECPNIGKYLANNPSEEEWMKFRCMQKNEDEESSFYSEFLSELKEKQINDISGYIENKYFPQETDEAVCLNRRYDISMQRLYTCSPNDYEWVFWSLLLGRYYAIKPDDIIKFSEGDIYWVSVKDKKIKYKDGVIVISYIEPTISLCEFDKITDDSFWKGNKEVYEESKEVIQEYKYISSFVAGNISFIQCLQEIERRVKALDIKAIIDSYDVKVRTWWKSNPGKDDDECFERIVTSLYSDIYIEKFLPQNSTNYYSSGGCRPWMDYGEEETRRLQSIQDRTTKQLKSEALKKYSQSEHIITLINAKVQELTKMFLDIELKYHVNAAIQFLHKAKLGDNPTERREKLFSFRLQDVIDGSNS